LRLGRALEVALGAVAFERFCGAGSRGHGRRRAGGVPAFIDAAARAASPWTSGLPRVRRA
jgi:hypothetical protein